MAQQHPKAGRSDRLGIPSLLLPTPPLLPVNPSSPWKPKGSPNGEQLGFAAIGDTALMRQFADIARQGIPGVGIPGGLHPSIDLYRAPLVSVGISEYLREDAHLSARLVSHHPWAFGAQLDSNG